MRIPHVTRPVDLRQPRVIVRIPDKNCQHPRHGGGGFRCVGDVPDNGLMFQRGVIADNAVIRVGCPICDIVRTKGRVVWRNSVVGCHICDREVAIDGFIGRPHNSGDLPER